MAGDVFRLHDFRIKITEETLADHLRKQIRDVATSELQTAMVPADLEEVRAGRVWPYKNAELPAGRVFTRREVVVEDQAVMGNYSGGIPTSGAHFRQVELMLEIRVKAPQDATPIPDDQLDALALTAEQTLSTSGGLRALVHHIEMASTESSLDMEAGGGKPLALLTMVWAVIYRVDPNDPSVRR